MTAIPLGVELHLPKAPVGGMCPAINGDICFVSLKCPLLPTSLECRELALHYTWIKFICHRTGVGIWCPNGLGCIAYYRVIMGQFIGIHQIIININWCFTARYSDVGRIYSSCIIQCAANKYKQNIITMITHIWSIQSPPPLPKLSGQNPFHDYQLQYGPLLPTTVCYSTVCISYIGFIFVLGYSVRRRGGAKLGQFHSHFHHWHFIKCS